MSRLMLALGIKSIFVMFVPLTFMFGISIYDEETYYEDDFESGMVGGVMDIFLGFFCVRLLFFQK